MFQKGFFAQSTTTILVRSAIIYQIYDVVFPSQDTFVSLEMQILNIHVAKPKTLDRLKRFVRYTPKV